MTRPNLNKFRKSRPAKHKTVAAASVRQCFARVHTYIHFNQSINQSINQSQAWTLGRD